MKIWVDDIRTPPDEGWTWATTSHGAITILDALSEFGPTGQTMIEIMSLDHDLGGDDTSRRIVLWMCENDFWPVEVRVHSMNPVGRSWLQEMIWRYKP